MDSARRRSTTQRGAQACVKIAIGRGNQQDWLRINGAREVLGTVAGAKEAQEREWTPTMESNNGVGLRWMNLPLRNPKFRWQSTVEKEEIIPRKKENRAQPLGGINGAKKVCVYGNPVNHGRGS